MCEKRIVTRNHLLFYVAVLICLSISGCTSLQGRLARGTPSGDEVREHMALGQKLLARHDYQGALQEYQTALSMSGDRPPGDEALFLIGQIYGDPENPAKDLLKSVMSFQTLTEEYPKSSRADLARILMESLKEQDQLRRLVAQSLQDNKRLTQLRNDALQENDRLKRLSGDSMREILKLKKAGEECSQENQRMKKMVDEYSQENQRMKKIVDESKTIDVEIDQRKRGQVK